MTHIINYDDIAAYLSFLDTDKEVFNYSLFDNETNNPIPGFGVCYGTQKEILEVIENLETPATLHVTLNRTKLTGRKRKDIESVRVACADIDRETDKETIRSLIEKHQPQLVVESSPGKYHLYWKLKPQVSLDEWEELQTGLGFTVGGDDQMASRTHMIRVPGVPRRTKSGEDFLPRIVYQVEAIEYGYEELLGLIPEIAAGIAKAKLQKEERRKALREQRAAKKDNSGTTQSFEKLACEENRNSTLYMVVKDAMFLWGREDGFKYGDPQPPEAIFVAEEFNKLLAIHNTKGALDASEVETTALSALQAALDAREQAAFKRRERQKKKEEEVREIQEAARWYPVEEPLGVAGEAYTNGHAGGHRLGFMYDFGTKELQVNKYSELAVVDRVLQKYGRSIVKVQGVVYAFDSEEVLWSAQNYRSCAVLTSMVIDCVNDMTAEEEFALEFAQTKQGVDPVKLRAETSKWKNKGKVSNIVAFLLDWKGVKNERVSPFDKNKYLYFCKNGVVDLLTGELRAATAGDFLLKRSEVVFTPQARCEWWVSFLGEVFGSNEDPAAIVAFIQEMFGYSLTGSIKEQIIFIHYGGGANGKSRVLWALAALLGEYGGRLQPDALGTKKTSMAKALERVAVKFEGCRGMLIDDLDTGMEWNEGLIKSLTESNIIARRLYEEERTIPNTAKIHISCNSIPKVEQSSHAVYRRLAILEYGRKFTVDPVKHQEIEDRTMGELSGILNWSIEGLRRVLCREKGSLEYPAEVRYAVEEYEENNSSEENMILKEVEIMDEKDWPHESWVTIDEVYNFLMNAGPTSGPTVTPRNAKSIEKLGRAGIGALLVKAGAKKRRLRVNGVKTRLYCVRLKNSENAATLFADLGSEG